jgi:outer membrane protein assembly factor BamB
METATADSWSSSTRSLQIHAIDAATGTQTWQRQLSGPVETPVFAAKNLYLTAGVHLYELAAANGQIVHEQTTTGIGYGDLFAAGDVLIGLQESLQTPDFHLIGLRLTDLTTLWQIPLPSTTLPDVKVSSTTVFVAIPGAGQERGVTMMAIDAKTGNQRWQRHMDLVWGSEWVASEQTLYIDTDTQPLTASSFNGDSLLTALDAATGKQLWQIALSFIDEPAAANADAVFVEKGERLVNGHLSASYVVALHATDGTPSWSTTFPIGLYGQADSGSILYGLTVTQLVAVDARTGHTIWTVTAVPNGARSTDVIGSTAVFVNIVSVPSKGAPINQIEAFKRSDGTLLWKYPIQGIVNWLTAG